MSDKPVTLAKAFIEGTQGLGSEETHAVCAAYLGLESRVAELEAALRLHIAYEALPADRGWRAGPKGRAWETFISARDAALTTPQQKPDGE